MSYTQKVAYNTAAQIVGKVVGIGISLFTITALFRYLGVEGVGKYTTVFAFVSFFSVFADFGLQWTLIRELAIQKDKNKVFQNILSLRLIISTVIYLLCFSVVWLFGYPLDVKVGVGIIAFSWFFTTMNSAFVGVFQNNYRLDLSVATDVLGRAIIYALVLFAISYNFGFASVLAAYIVGTAVNFFSNVFLSRRFVTLGFGRDTSYWPVLIRQALPIGMVLVFHFIYFKIDSLMLSWMRGMVDVGIYGTSYKLLEVLDSLPVMFLGASFPLITNYVISKDKRLSGAFQKQFDFLSLAGFPIVVGAYVLAQPIIDLIGGRSGEFSNTATVSFLGQPATSVTVLKILVFAIAISFFTNLYAYLIVALGKQKNMVLPTIGFALLNIILNLILIPVGSYIGSSFATLITELVVLVATVYIAGLYIKIPISYFAFAKIIACAVAMGVIAHYLNLAGVNLFVNIVIAAVVYGIFIFIVRAVPMDLVKSMIRRDA